MIKRVVIGCRWIKNRIFGKIKKVRCKVWQMIRLCTFFLFYLNICSRQKRGDSYEEDYYRKGFNKV